MSHEFAKELAIDPISKPFERASCSGLSCFDIDELKSSSGRDCRELGGDA